MPGSAPGVLKGRWQYCPMRTRRLCGLTLGVLALHAIGWQIAVGGPPPLAPARAGAQRVAWVSVPQRARVPSTPVAAPALAAPLAAPPPAASARAVLQRPRGGARACTPSRRACARGRRRRAASRDRPAPRRMAGLRHAGRRRRPRCATRSCRRAARRRRPAGSAELEWTQTRATPSRCASPPPSPTTRRANGKARARSTPPAWRRRASSSASTAATSGRSTSIATQAACASPVHDGRARPSRRARRIAGAGSRNWPRSRKPTRDTRPAADPLGTAGRRAARRARALDVPRAAARRSAAGAAAAR